MGFALGTKLDIVGSPLSKPTNLLLLRANNLSTVILMRYVPQSDVLFASFRKVGFEVVECWEPLNIKVTFGLAILYWKIF